MDGSYRTKSVDDLGQYLIQCMDIHGPNPVALHRLTHAAAIIRMELSSRLAGLPTWVALQEEVQALVSRVPKDHDVYIQVGDLLVTEARFIQPHTFLFQGINQDGHSTGIMVHFTQLHARVVYLPKQGIDRVITGFADGRKLN